MNVGEGEGKQRQGSDWQDWGFNGSNAKKDPGYSTRNIKYSAQCSYLAKVSKSSIGLYKQRNHM